MGTCTIIDNPERQFVDRSNKTYRLVGHEPVEERNLYLWAFWFETASTVVAQEMVGKLCVSTIFNAVAWVDGSLFETMVFAEGDGYRRKPDGLYRRYGTWAEAEAGHAEVVAEVKRDDLPDDGTGRSGRSRAAAVRRKLEGEE